MSEIVSTNASCGRDSTRKVLRSVNGNSKARLVVASSSTSTGPCASVDVMSFHGCRVYNRPTVHCVIGCACGNVRLCDNRLVLFRKRATGFCAIHLLVSDQTRVNRNRVSQMFSDLRFSPRFTLNSRCPRANIGGVAIGWVDDVWVSKKWGVFYRGYKERVSSRTGFYGRYKTAMGGARP